MSTKHTPGPWSCHPIEVSRFTWSIVHYGPIAYVGDIGDTEKEAATAHLIAASPDLLANLAGLLAWIDDAKQQPSSRPHMPDESYLASARAAVDAANRY